MRKIATANIGNTGNSGVAVEQKSPRVDTESQNAAFKIVWNAIVKREQCVKSTIFSDRNLSVDSNKFTHIGIVDGMGPAAGTHFVGLLLEQGFSKLEKHERTDQNAPQHTLDSRSGEIGDRTAYLAKHNVAKLSPEAKERVLTAQDPANPLTGILRSIKVVERAGARVFVVTCNTAHAWASYFPKENGMRFVHIVDAALKSAIDSPEIKAKIDRGEKVRIGLLATTGTIKNEIYRNRLKELIKENDCLKNVEFVVPDDDIQENFVMKGIYDKDEGVKSGNLEAGGKLLKAAALHLKDEKKVDALSLSCTEIPIVLSKKNYPKDFPTDFPIIDATVALVKETIDVSMQLREADRKIEVKAKL